MPEDKPAEEVEAAIAEVLAAERDALAAIEAARREGEEILLGARTLARRIAERGEQRLARLREAAARRIRQQTELVEAEIARLAAAAIGSPADEAGIAAAVAAVAAEMSRAQTTPASRAPQEHYIRAASPALQGAAAATPHPLPREGGRSEDR